MTIAFKDEIVGLVSSSLKKNGYSDVNASVYDHTGIGHPQQEQQQPPSLPSRLHRWKVIGLASIALLVGFISGRISIQTTSIAQRWNLRKSTATTAATCHFCDQSPPKLHRDKSYTIQIQNPNSDNNNSNEVVVTPMTITYDYELYDGENLFTNNLHEHIPNLGFDYAVLGVGSARNLRRDTGEAVSLDEVYFHHLTISPINMIGAEIFTRDGNGDRDDDASDPYMSYPKGYALHVLADERPHLSVNAHLLSNRNLAPIDGSLERAHKECNECFYAPGKGSECTPEFSGTFKCCGDSAACTSGGEDCACATTSIANHGERKTTMKYRVELDLLISEDMRAFQRVDQWNFAAPACSINLKGDAILEDYPSDNFCSDSFARYSGGGSLFHQIPENDEVPYVRTFVNVMAPSGGRMVFAQSHLHTGGVNATLYKNGEIVCATEAEYGSNSDPISNARDEQNHLVRISSCYDQIGKDYGIRFEAGDVFRTESYYYGGTDDVRFSSKLAAGEHRNVMSMFFMGVVLDGDSRFTTDDRTSFSLWNDFVHLAGIGI